MQQQQLTFEMKGRDDGVNNVYSLCSSSHMSILCLLLFLGTVHIGERNGYIVTSIWKMPLCQRLLPKFFANVYSCQETTFFLDFFFLYCFLWFPPFYYFPIADKVIYYMHKYTYKLDRLPEADS